MNSQLKTQNLSYAWSGWWLKTNLNKEHEGKNFALIIISVLKKISKEMVIKTNKKPGFDGL